VSSSGTSDVSSEAEEKGQGDEPWSIADIPATLSALDELLAPRGWSVSAHGSTLLRGEGRDLDLFALPVYVNASPIEEVFEAIAAHWVVCSDITFDFTHLYWQAVFLDRRGRLIDIAFWRRGDDEGPKLRDIELEDAIYEDGWGMGV